MKRGINKVLGPHLRGVKVLDGPQIQPDNVMAKRTIDNTPRKVEMWKDLEMNPWDTEKECRNSNDKILETREYQRKTRIISKHVDSAFEDWLKHTESTRACDMRKGAMKMIWYFLNNKLLKESMFDE